MTNLVSQLKPLQSIQTLKWIFKNLRNILGMNSVWMVCIWVWTVLIISAFQYLLLKISYIKYVKFEPQSVFSFSTNYAQISL